MADNQSAELFGQTPSQTVGPFFHYGLPWKGGADLSPLKGKTVHFRFQLSHGQLYSFWVSPETSGASHGYVAAGGPGFGCRSPPAPMPPGTSAVVNNRVSASIGWPIPWCSG